MAITDPPFDPTVTVAIDAISENQPVVGRFASPVHCAKWAYGRPDYEEPAMRPDVPNPAHWWDTRVGWGLILPERPGLSHAELAGAVDAPEPIRRLVAERNGKVLRYQQATSARRGTLRDYAAKGDIFPPGAEAGTGPRQLPMYLLIYAPPSEVPWQVQFRLNPVRYVGRLDLTDDALANYVNALLTDWKDAPSSYASPVVWAVDDGSGITRLMRDTIAAPIYKAFAADGEMPQATFIDGSKERGATIDALYRALGNMQPSLIVTTSHGEAGPLQDLAVMRSNLGLPVDHKRQILSPGALLDVWQPHGAIWFVQACCSAGCDSPSRYAELFEPEDELHETLTGVATLGAATSPLAAALLGAAHPLRALIGHVEPTFNWTLSFPANQQALTEDLRKALYDGLASGQPVGLAMSRLYPAIGSLLSDYDYARTEYNERTGKPAQIALRAMVYNKVTAHDRANTVILGDPTAALPLPPPIHTSGAGTR